MTDFVFHPVIKLGISEIVTVRLENGVPPKVCTASGRTNCAVGDPLEKHRGLSWTFAICKNALDISGLVLKGIKETHHVLNAHALQKPLDIGARHATKRIEAQARELFRNAPSVKGAILPSVFDNYFAFQVASSFMALVLCNLFRCSLILIEHGEVFDGQGTNDSFRFNHLVGVNKKKNV